VLVIGIVLTLFNLYLSDTPQVIPVSTTKSAIFLRNQQAYDAAAHAALDKAFWNGNKLTINTDRITADLRAQFPELAGVTVSVPFAGNRVRVYVEPATPQLLLSSNNTLYVVDTSGRALIAAAQVPRIEKLGLPVVNDQTGLPVEAGKAALPSTSVAFITEIVAQLKAKSITISSLTLPAGTSEMDVRISGVGYFVKFNLQGNAREEAGAFLAVKKQLERDRITPQTYIDVRVEERAYYR
jgi:cell division septal protein FtsQ